MREPKYHIYLDETEYQRVIELLIALKNNLIQQGKYTDAVDDLLIKFSPIRKKKIKVEYR